MKNTVTNPGYSLNTHPLKNKAMCCTEFLKKIMAFSALNEFKKDSSTI